VYIKVVAPGKPVLEKYTFEIPSTVLVAKVVSVPNIQFTPVIQFHVFMASERQESAGEL